MEDHHGNLVGYSGLCVAVFQWSVTKHKTEGMHNHTLWNLQSLFSFLIKKGIWKKNTLPVAQGFSSWWAALTSVAVLLGTGIGDCCSSAWRCLGSSPTHSSPQARWVVVCEETSVTGERHYPSSPMCLVCLLVQWCCDGVCFTLCLLLMNKAFYLAQNGIGVIYNEIVSEEKQNCCLLN